MATEKPKKNQGRGGARAGAGRPPKIKDADLRELPNDIANLPHEEVLRRRDYWQSERNREAAESARLANEKERGRLVEASTIEARWASRGHQTRSGLEAAVERDFPDLYARQGMSLMECRNWLSDFVRRALTGIADAT